jgi:WD40 repeat protein
MKVTNIMESKRENKSINPFPGLRPFAPEESENFHGRSSECGEVIAKLFKNRYVSVIGTAGTGKSSLINAGIIPDINKMNIKESGKWNIISFRPGANPFSNLAAAVSNCFSNSGHEKTDINLILNEINEKDNDLTTLISQYSNPKDNVLVVIDQLEDVFRFTSPSEKGIADQFIKFVVNSILHPDTDIFFLLSMRSEYLGECSHHWELARLINNSNYLIQEPGFEGWKEIVEGSLKVTGKAFSTELYNEIIDGIRSADYRLAVFQHVMMRTWEIMSKDTIRPVDIHDYNSAGTIRNSLSLHAAEIYEGLDPHQKAICSVMFKAITRKGSDNKGLRHPSGFQTIKSIAGCNDNELKDIIDKFSAACFISLGEDPVNTIESTVDLQTEYLIIAWNRLKEWIDEESASMQMYLRLSEASALYQQGKAGLFKSPDLQSAIKWRNQNKPILPWAVQYNPAFERAMVYLRTSEVAYAEEEENRKVQQKRNLKRAGMTAKALGAAVLIAIGATSYLYYGKMIAEKKAIHTEVARMMLVRQKASSDSTARSALSHATEADSIAETAVRKTQEAIAQKIRADKDKINAENYARQVLYQKDEAVELGKDISRLRMISLGKSMSLKSLQLTGQKDLQSLLAYQAYLFNKKNNGSASDPDIYAGLYNVDKVYGGINYRTFAGHNGEIKSIAFVPGRNEFFSSGSDGKILKWDLNKKDQTLQVVYSGSDIMDVIAVSPDESWLAAGGSGSSIRMIPLKGNTMAYEMNGHKGKIKSLIFSYDGKYLYSAALDGKVLKWDIAARTSVDVATGMMQITSLDISSHGNYLAGISNDGNVMVWNPEKNAGDFKIETSGKNVKVIRFNPSNNLLAMGDDNGNVEIWDVEKRKKISEIRAHDTQINDIRFNSVLTQMATAGNDKTIKIFNLDDLNEPPVMFADNNDIVLVMQFSPDGQMIVSGSTGGTDNLVGRATNSDYLASNICNLVSRNMSQSEWNTYVAKDVPLEKTCQVRNLNIKFEQVAPPKK